jgi:hypothetical protein
MEEAARRLGVSVATIRRKLHSGELQGSREPTSQGFKWLVELPEDTRLPEGEPTGEPDGEADTSRLETSSDGEVAALKELVRVLETELEARRREVQELHVLLQQAQKALPTPRVPGRAWWRRFWPLGLWAFFIS